MTRHHEPDPGFDPRVADWLEDDPDTAPGQVLETVFAAFPSIPQRRSVRLQRRPPVMNRSAYLAAAVAMAVIAVAVVGAGGLMNSPAPGTVASLPPPSSIASSPKASSSAMPIKPLARNGAIALPRKSAIVLIDPITGKTLKTLPVSSAELGDLTWAADGRRLAFAGTGGVWVMDVSDGTSRQILTCGEGADGCSIAWAPDGSRIAVAHGATLDLIDPDGSNRVTVFIHGGGLAQPTWSPDGRRIGVVGWLGDLGRGLYIVNRDKSDPTLLLGPVKGIGVFDPAWSPDGSTIAYLGSTDRDCGAASKSACNPWQLHVMSLALGSSQPRELHEAGTCYCLGFAPSLTWSPDGTSIAIDGPGGDSSPGGLMVMNADGTELRQVLADGGGPAWQPVP
jgi:Tol biopolymer transport system component